MIDICNRFWLSRGGPRGSFVSPGVRVPKRSVRSPARPTPCRAKSPRFLAGAAIALWAMAGPSFAAGDQIPNWTQGLDRALSAKPFRSARVGALVVRRGNGEILYARSPDRLLIPASNMKLLTAWAALDHYGPTHRFETVIRADHPVDAEGRVGELVVVGGGDPALNSEDWWRLAADLHARGLREVVGDLWVDDSFFDREYWHSAWGPISFRAYHAPVAALSANYGAFFVGVRPGEKKGAPLSVSVDPPLDYLWVDSRGKTVGAGGETQLLLKRGQAEKYREVFQVHGQMRLGDGAQRFARSVRDPALYAGEILRLQLRSLGIEVGGRVRRQPSQQPSELLRYRGRPLSEIVRLFMKYSNNAVAETLVKGFGASENGSPGTWPAGIEVMSERLGSLGLLPAGAVVVDGSGLSPGNRLSARLIVDILRRAENSFELGPEFMSALPISGRDGTLEKRTLRSAGAIRGKTGLLKQQGVIALSGTARRRNGEELFFSILVNGFEGSPDDAMRAMDSWVDALVGDSP